MRDHLRTVTIFCLNWCSRICPLISGVWNKILEMRNHLRFVGGKTKWRKALPDTSSLLPLAVRGTRPSQVWQSFLPRACLVSVLFKVCQTCVKTKLSEDADHRGQWKLHQMYWSKSFSRERNVPVLHCVCVLWPISIPCSWLRNPSTCVWPPQAVQGDVQSLLQPPECEDSTGKCRVRAERALFQPHVKWMKRTRFL